MLKADQGDEGDRGARPRAQADEERHRGQDVGPQDHEDPRVGAREMREESESGTAEGLEVAFARKHPSLANPQPGLANKQQGVDHEQDREQDPEEGHCGGRLARMEEGVPGLAEGFRLDHGLPFEGS